MTPLAHIALSFARLLRPLSLALALVVGLHSPGAAASLDDALSALRTRDAEAIKTAIAQLAELEDPRALAVLTALSDGRLAFDGNGLVLIQTASGFVDAQTAAPVTPNGEPESPPVTNVLRRALAPALAQSQLRAKDAEVRRAAALELSKRPNEELADALRAARAVETESDVAELLGLALAQIDLDSDDPARRLGALETIESSGSVYLKERVEVLTRPGPDGTSAEPDPAVRAKASAVLAGLERRVFAMNGLANVLYGLSLGSVLLLAALGLAITFGILRVINMAHGEMLMIGAYATFAVQNLFRSLAPAWFDWYLLFAIPVAFAVTALLGAFLERTVIRFLYGRPLETLLATWGISLALIQTVRVIFGAQNVAVANPSWLSGGWELMPNVVLPYSRVATILFSAFVVAFVWFLLQRTRLGMYVRAVTQNRDMAGSVGIATRTVDVWTFALGSGVAGLGGVALSQLGNVGPELGQSYIVDSFMVVVLGGVGNIVGTIAGALGLGIINKLLEPAMGAVLGKILVLGIIILFIQWRPQGMFALKGRAAEL